MTLKFFAVMGGGRMAKLKLLAKVCRNVMLKIPNFK